MSWYADFFPSKAALDRFTYSLDAYTSPTDACPHCGGHQWVSHGYVYKQLSIQERHTVGKRILCANRYGRQGCGRTRQLYLNDIVPRKHYTLSVVVAFIYTLLDRCPVEQAYLRATGSSSVIAKDARQAWRWLKGFFKSLPQWRRDLLRDNESTLPARRSSTLSLLLPTLQTLSHRVPLADYQHQYQCAFF